MTTPLNLKDYLRHGENYYSLTESGIKLYLVAMDYNTLSISEVRRLAPWYIDQKLIKLGITSTYTGVTNDTDTIKVAKKPIDLLLAPLPKVDEVYPVKDSEGVLVWLVQKVNTETRVITIKEILLVSEARRKSEEHVVGPFSFWSAVEDRCYQMPAK
jgi:hypothetical protein